MATERVQRATMVVAICGVIIGVVFFWPDVESMMNGWEGVLIVGAVAMGLSVVRPEAYALAAPAVGVPLGFLIAHVPRLIDDAAPQPLFSAYIISLNISFVAAFIAVVVNRRQMGRVR